MKRILTLAVFAALAVSACSKEDDMKNVPGPNGLLPDGSPPQSPAPTMITAGTYDGRAIGNPRPAFSGLNADPNNPNGAPGNYSQNTMR
jgi:hypothetical protein